MDGFQTHGSISTCSSYCEQQVQFFYGPESVFTQFSQCRANEPCSFTTTDSKTITNSYSFTLTGGLKARSDETGLTRRDEDAADLKPTFNLVSFSSIVLRSTTMITSANHYEGSDLRLFRFQHHRKRFGAVKTNHGGRSMWTLDFVSHHNRLISKAASW